MNYWITSHWPPRKSQGEHSFDHGVYLPDGRQSAGHDLSVGDIVFIYEARSGRTALKRRPNGNTYHDPCTRGKEGIIAVCEVDGDLYADSDSQPENYVDGTQIWWRWYAPTKCLTSSGFLPRSVMNPIIGYKPTYNLRGLGEQHSGLKKITKQQYLALLAAYSRSVAKLPPSHPPIDRHGESHIDGGGESPEHLLLKQTIARDPAGVLGEPGLVTLHVEYGFSSGDRADIVLQDSYGRLIGLEVEVRVRDGEDAGLLQAIKYRRMLELVSDRTMGDSRSMLVAYTISEKMRSIAERYEIECFEIPQNVLARQQS